MQPELPILWDLSLRDHPGTKCIAQASAGCTSAKPIAQPPPTSPGFGTWFLLVHMMPLGVVIDGGVPPMIESLSNVNSKALDIEYVGVDV